MPASVQGVESKTGDLRPHEHFLAARGRKLCLYLGIFVAYSQFTSIGLLALSRYHVAWDGGRYFKADGYLNESFLVLSLIIPGGEIGLKSGSMMLFTLVAARSAGGGFPGSPDRRLALAHRRHDEFGAGAGESVSGRPAKQAAGA
jgi:hypothetical protein